MCACEIDEIKFKYFIDREIESIDNAVLTLFDSSDVYTYYYLIGMKAGIYNAKVEFDHCKVD